MNEPTLPLGTTIPSEVRLFLAAVRRELGDLDPDEVAEMTDGLEADLGDLVAERGPSALGDPKAYARELRTAAGIGETEPPAQAQRRTVRESVTGMLDAAHEGFDRQVDRLPGDARPVLTWLRPAWWILRAWLAVQLVDLVLGGARYNGVGLVPGFAGPLGWLMLAVAVLLSIQMGRGRLWPGSRGSLAPRLVLLGLNGLAVAIAPFVLSAADSGSVWAGAWQEGYNVGHAEATTGLDETGEATGLSVGGRQVTNIYPYDAAGRPLSGVQLFDQDGKPIDIAASYVCPANEHGERGEEYVMDAEGNETVQCFDYATGEALPATVFYPWTNGQAQLRNVFPIATREQQELEPSATAFQEADRPTLGTWPFATVPGATLPGIIAGIVDAETGEPTEPTATKAPRKRAGD